MARRVLLCLSHSIEESDQLDLLSSLGYDCASVGGYINPHTPHDPKRPALPHVSYFPEVQEAVDAIGTDDNLGAAQSRIPDAILEWLGPDGVLVFHHYLSQRLFPQWDHLRDWRESGGRVVWRTVGQSVEANEAEAAPFRADGLEIVRYSPKERNIPGYVGEDALIRFWKDPDEWSGWTGEQRTITNVTQKLVQRDPWTSAGFWATVTAGLPTYPVGEGSEIIGGPGVVEYGVMRAALRESRVYLYTGTQPASYTLGLIEALMTGIPVVSIGPAWMTIFPYGPDLFEGHELAWAWDDDPARARKLVLDILDDPGYAVYASEHQRTRALETFSRDAVGDQWLKFLGEP